MRMRRTQNFFADGERAFEQRSRRLDISLCQHQRAEIVEIVRGAEMLRAKRLLEDRQRALAQRPRRSKFALTGQHDRKIVEAGRGQPMVGTERLFPDGEHPLGHCACLREMTLFVEKDTEVVKGACRLQASAAQTRSLVSSIGVTDGPVVFLDVTLSYRSRRSHRRWRDLISRDFAATASAARWPAGTQGAP